VRGIDFALMTYGSSTALRAKRSESSVSSPNRMRMPGLNNEDEAMKTVPLSELKDDLSRYLRLAETEEIVITRHGKPAGVLIGFGSEDDWFDYRLEHDPRFRRRLEAANKSLDEGRGIRLEDFAE
jgi:prevent-host-death family protein